MSKIYSNKRFMLFLLADVVSSFAVGMGAVGFNWYVLAETNATHYVGLFFTINVLSGFLVSPVIGYLIDRFQRKWLLFGSFLFRGLMLLAIWIVFQQDLFSITLMVLYTIVNGIGWAAYLSISKSFLQEILDSDELSTGNSIIEISMQVGMLSAGALTGLLYTFSGFRSILLFCTLGFFISGGLIFCQKSAYPKEGQAREHESFFSSFKSGLTYINRDRYILLLSLLAIFPLIVTMLYNIVLPSYVTVVLAETSVAFGLADMFYGIGGLASGFLVVIVVNHFKKHTFIFLFYSLAGLVLFWLALEKQTFVLYAGSLMLGIANSGLRILMNTLLMEKVKPVYMGRVMAVYTAISLFLQMIGSTVIGWVTDSFDASSGFILLGAVMTVGLVTYLFTIKKQQVGGSIE